MKIIVCGLGQVGSGIVRYLASGDADIIGIDLDPENVKRVTDNYDVRGIVGNCAQPNVLENASAGDADILITVTQFDEVNILTCEIANTLFGTPMKIARVRDDSYRHARWSQLFESGDLAIDMVISPEYEVAKSLGRLIEIPGVFDMVPLHEEKLRLLGVICTENTPLIHTPLRQIGELFKDLNISIIAVFRDKTAFIPDSQAQLLPGDKVYFLVETKKLQRALYAFGFEDQQLKKLIIVGGGKIGLNLAQNLKQTKPSLPFMIVDRNREHAYKIVEQLQDKIVLHGDILEHGFFKELNVRGDETFLALTNSSETNILASLLAKHHGCRRTISLVTTQNFDPLMGGLGIDAIIHPHLVTISSILGKIRRGKIQAAHSLHEEFGEVFEAQVMESSKLIGIPMGDLNLPEGLIIASIIRGTLVEFPTKKFVLEPHDRLVLFSLKSKVKKAEKLLSVGLDYF